MSAPPSFEELRHGLARARAGWRNRGNPAAESPPPGVTFETPGPGQESVWSYPRPPRVEDVRERARVVFSGVTIANSTRTLRVLETAGAPVIYFPPEDVVPGVLQDADRWTICEWKGVATALDVVAGNRIARGGAWSYREPFADLGMGYERIRGYVGFLPALMEACYLGDERVRPQPGGYYGGWVTDALAGPIKGGPGSEGW